jgi:hypothetical protein
VHCIRILEEFGCIYLLRTTVTSLENTASKSSQVNRAEQLLFVCIPPHNSYPPLQQIYCYCEYDAPSHATMTVWPTAVDSGCILTKHTSIPSSPFRTSSWTEKHPQVSFEAAPRLILDRRLLSSGISQLPQDVLGSSDKSDLFARSDKATWRHGSFANLGEMRRNGNPT